MSLSRSVLIKSKMRRAKRSWVDSLPFPKFRACVAHEGNDEIQVVKTLHSISELAQLPGPLFLAIGDLGVEHLLVINFDRKFAATSPESFNEQLAADSKPLREICVGHEWSFGKDRRGDLALLKKLGAQFHFDVVGIP